MALLPPISVREVAEGLYGATRLAKADPRGIYLFGDTSEAFWKSFWAAVIAAPLHATSLAIGLADTHIASGWLRVLLIETIAYVVLWTAFPLAMYYVVQAIDREESYFRFIGAANWGFVVQTTFALAVEALLRLDILPGLVAQMI